MKDGPLSKLKITEGGQQATQYKKILDALPVFCADKGYKFTNEVIQTNTEQLQSAFMLTYPLASRWSNIYHVQVETVNLLAVPDPNTSKQAMVIKMQMRTNVFDPNLQ